MRLAMMMFCGLDFCLIDWCDAMSLLFCLPTSRGVGGSQRVAARGVGGGGGAGGSSVSVPFLEGFHFSMF